MLNDPSIRKALLEKLRNRKPKAILEELHVHNGNAIADVVTLDREAHCYEIKGSGDKIARIREQGYYYDSVFRRITLVTTENHIKKALELASPHWGIMLAKITDQKIVIQNIRGSKISPLFDKEKALRTLWKCEMLDLLEDPKCQRSSKEVLSQLIAETTKNLQISSQICSMLIDRSQRL